MSGRERTIDIWGFGVEGVEGEVAGGVGGTYA